MMRDVAALVLAGGRVGDFGVLTTNRPKGALTFAGGYRVIDFGLSALRRAGIERVGIIIQYLPASLIEHVGVGRPWDLDGPGRSLKVMPPFVGVDTTEWYKGTADALLRNLNFLEDLSATHVVVMSGEQVYDLDFAAVMDAHTSRGADVTVVTKQIPDHKRSRRFGYVTVDDNGRVKAYHEKPPQPQGDLVSAGIFVFRTDTLVGLLRQNADAGAGGHNLAKDVLQPHVAALNAYEHRLDGYWEYMDGTDEYHHVQMQLLRDGAMDELRGWGTLTNMEYRDQGCAPPARFGPAARAVSTLACPGSRVDGASEESILSPGVVVEAGATVRRSILMHDARVEAGAVLEGVIADKDTVFGPGCRVGVQGGPLTVIGKGARIGPGVTIAAGAEVRPGRHLHDQPAADAEV